MASHQTDNFFWIDYVFTDHIIWHVDYELHFRSPLHSGISSCQQMAEGFVR